MKGKMAIIGDGDSVLAFTAGGVEAFTADSTEAAKELLKKLAKDYKIIFITDVISKELDDQIRKYVSSPYPIIISLPSKNGSNGYGMESLKLSMDKALGVDILFNNENEEGK